MCLFLHLKNCLPTLMNLKKMNYYTGEVSVADSDLNLDLTLLGGQSFRWEKTNTSGIPIWRGVAYDTYWEIEQTPTHLKFRAYPNEEYFRREKENYFTELIKDYFRLDFDLQTQIVKWRKCHEHFEQLSIKTKSVRVLNQEPLENIISFICSQNNNIKRISNMVQWLCKRYGQKIGEFRNKNEYTFPTLENLINNQSDLESTLRDAKFGYRAKFISNTIVKVMEFGGSAWFAKLRSLDYTDAREELIKLPGIGYKVADCICLMSLNHLESVPIDTHLYKIAKKVYLPHLSTTKNINVKLYNEIANHFRKVYGVYAGWAQAVLFCSELQQFQNESEKVNGLNSMKKRK